MILQSQRLLTLLTWRISQPTALCRSLESVGVSHIPYCASTFAGLTTFSPIPLSRRHPTRSMMSFAKLKILKSWIGQAPKVHPRHRVEYIFHRLSISYLGKHCLCNLCFRALFRTSLSGIQLLLSNWWVLSHHDKLVRGLSRCICYRMICTSAVFPFTAESNWAPSAFIFCPRGSSSVDVGDLHNVAFELLPFCVLGTVL